jgi:hypothetical protein
MFLHYKKFFSKEEIFLLFFKIRKNIIQSRTPNNIHENNIAQYNQSKKLYLFTQSGQLGAPQSISCSYFHLDSS